MARPMTRRRGGIALVLLLSVVAPPAHAVEPSEMLADPKLEGRARDISQKLRCVVCQNQSIDDSNAPLAKDLRVLVRERLTAGDSDRQAMDFIVARYGNFVLLRPPVQVNTLLLWIGPLLLAGLAALGFWRFLGAKARDLAHETPDTLTDADNARIEALLASGASPARNESRQAS